MKKRFCILGGLLLTLLILCGHALADSGLSAQGLITVHSISTEAELRKLNGCVVTSNDLNANEYYSFTFCVTNNSRSTQTFRPYARIDGGEQLWWQTISMAPGEKLNFHIYYSNMGKLSGGTYKVDFYTGDGLLASQYFSLPRKWSGVMSLPTAAELQRFSSDKRSAYVVCEPQFSGVSGYTQYAVDFKVDYAPTGTYVCVANWDFDLSVMQRQYKSVELTSISGYCGLQVLEDGTRVAIMSLWDLLCTDQNGKQVVFQPTVTYSANSYRIARHDEAGNGAQAMVRFNWEDGHPYRALLQLSTSETTGNTKVTFWLMDLVTMKWVEVAEFDCGFSTPAIRWCSTFLENFRIKTAGSVRTVEWSNFRVYSTANQWVSAKSASFRVHDSAVNRLSGSYNWGSDGKTFWAITSGLPNRATAPTRNAFTVNAYETGSPIP